MAVMSIGCLVIICFGANFVQVVVPERMVRPFEL